MRKYFRYVIICSVFTFTCTTQQSCKSAKEGCGQEEKYAPDMESKGGKSNLFSKTQRKKMKKKS
ncbi:MAG: hypothetical protein IPO92_23115 [Saprospiraceae bacterium]|nr:hypothetical protein [Saprospiraceae bacterium]